VGVMSCPKAPPRCAGEWCREWWRVPQPRLAEGPRKRRNAIAGWQAELKFLQSFLGHCATSMSRALQRAGGGATRRGGARRGGPKRGGRAAGGDRWAHAWAWALAAQPDGQTILCINRWRYLSSCRARRSSMCAPSPQSGHFNSRWRRRPQHRWDIECPQTNVPFRPLLLRIASAGRIEIRQSQRSAGVRRDEQPNDRPVVRTNVAAKTSVQLSNLPDSTSSSAVPNNQKYTNAKDTDPLFSPAFPLPTFALPTFPVPTFPVPTFSLPTPPSFTKTQLPTLSLHRPFLAHVPTWSVLTPAPDPPSAFAALPRS